MNDQLQLYYLSWCGFCRASKRLLESEKIPFQLIDITSDQAAIDDIKTRMGHRTMPIVVYRGELIGGYNELTSYISRNGAGSLRP